MQVQKRRHAEWVKRGIELRHFAALEAVADGLVLQSRRDGARLHAVGRQPADRGARADRGPAARAPAGRPAGGDLTEAGALLLEHAHAIGTRIAAAEADLDALAGGERGTLRVGSFQAAGARILPRVLRRFLTEAPGVSIELTESVTDIDDRRTRSSAPSSISPSPSSRCAPGRSRPRRCSSIPSSSSCRPAGGSCRSLRRQRHGRSPARAASSASAPAPRPGSCSTYLRERGIEPDVVLALGSERDAPGRRRGGSRRRRRARGSPSTSHSRRPSWLELGQDAPARAGVAHLAFRAIAARRPLHTFVGVARDVSAEIAAAMRHQEGKKLGRLSCCEKRS